MAIKGLRFAILHTGWIEKDKANDLAMYGMGNASNRTPAATWWRVPVISILIDHPQSGWILIDGGARFSCRYGEGGRLPEDERYNPFYAEEEQRIDRQLALCGVEAKDLSMVVLSNMDWSRTGILPLLRATAAGQNIIVPRADYAYGSVETRLKGAEVERLYRPEDFREKEIGFRYIDCDQIIATGVELLMLPGVFPATLGVRIEAENGNFIFPGAAMPTAENFVDPAIPPSNCYDSLEFQQTAKRLRQIAAQPGTQIIFASDPERFRSFQTAPYFY